MSAALQLEEPTDTQAAAEKRRAESVANQKHIHGEALADLIAATGVDEVVGKAVIKAVAGRKVRR